MEISMQSLIVSQFFSTIFSNMKDLFHIDVDLRRQSNIDLSNAKLTFVRNHNDTIDLFGNFLFIDISSANRE